MSLILTDIFDLLEFNTGFSQNIARSKTAACNQQVWEQRDSTALFGRFTLALWLDLSSAFVVYLLTLACSSVTLCRSCVCHARGCVIINQAIAGMGTQSPTDQPTKQPGWQELIVSTISVDMVKRLKSTNSNLPFVCGRPDNHAFSQAGGRRGHRAQQSEHPAFAPSHPLG